MVIQISICTEKSCLKMENDRLSTKRAMINWMIERKMERPTQPFSS
jgi:hypothetical protein